MTSMPSIDLSTHSVSPDASKSARSGLPTGSPVMPMMMPWKPMVRSWRVASAPPHRGIWLSMSTKSKGFSPRASPSVTSSTAAWPSSATWHSMSAAVNIRAPSVICSMRSSSTCRHLITPLRAEGMAVTAAVASAADGAAAWDSMSAATSLGDLGAFGRASMLDTWELRSCWHKGCCCDSRSACTLRLLERERRLASASRAGALGRRSLISNVVPLSCPWEEMWSLDLLCRSRIERTMLRPRPVPPLPWSWPLPTWANASPRCTTASSAGVIPAPSSMTRQTTCSSFTSVEPVSCMLCLLAFTDSTCTVTVCPARENLMAFERPFPRH
mmetsp:Transcript_791/g.2221  ORF Transcript_791/g.2221 Transcript_791/m.2221 type:complete len:328 (-) Transcript_791:1245-2228(-)